MRFRQGVMPWERTANMLLTKAELGRTKPTVRDLPPDDHVYGDRVPYGPEDSNEGEDIFYDSHVQLEIPQPNQYEF